MYSMLFWKTKCVHGPTKETVMLYSGQLTFTKTEALAELKGNETDEKKLRALRLS